MKHRKKWAGAAIAAFVALGMLGTAVPVNADPSATTTIEITGDSVDGHLFSAYRIATYVPESTLVNEGEVTAFRLKTVDSAIPLLTEFIKDEVESDVPVGSDPLAWVADNWADGQTEAMTKLAGYIAGNVNGLGLSAHAGSPTVAPLSVLEGLHLVVDETPRGSGATENWSSFPIIIGTKFKVDTDEFDLDGHELGKIKAKGETVRIDKDIDEAPDDGTDKWNDPTEDADSWTARDGDTVNFTIRTNIPTYPTPPYDVDKLMFNIVDTWTDGLAITETTDFIVTVGDDTLPREDYELDWTTQRQVTIKLNAAVIADNPGENVTVTYGATVTIGDGHPHADDTFTHDTNTAWVEFTKDWTTSTYGKTAGDEVDVFTFPFEIVKRDLVSSQLLEGAEFTLTGPFGDAADNELAPGMTKSTDTSGKARFEGLAGNAWYNVEETARPTGYVDANTPLVRFAFKIETAYDETGVVTVTYTFGPFVEGATNEASFTAFTTGPDGLALDGFLDIIQKDGDGGNPATDYIVDVFNAKTTSDMPSTGGQILLIVGLAGVLGLGGLTFGAVGLRKRKLTAAAVQTA